MGMLDNLGEIYASNLASYSMTVDTTLANSRSITEVSMEAKNLRFLAAAEIRLQGNAALFRSRVDRAVRLKISLFEGYDKGLAVSPSHVTMSGFRFGLDAFAAGNLQLGREFFSAIGGRVKEERQSDSKFISSIGYAVKMLVEHGKCPVDLLAKMKQQFSEPSVIGYAMLVEGISNRDDGLAEKGINEVIKGHKALIRPGGMFALTPDEIVCFWGLGLVNFAAYQGMKINVPENDLLPRSLLVPVQK